MVRNLLKSRFEPWVKWRDSPITATIHDRCPADSYSKTARNNPYRIGFESLPSSNPDHSTPIERLAVNQTLESDKEVNSDFHFSFPHTRDSTL
jgi:hypothetical protein